MWACAWASSISLCGTDTYEYGRHSQGSQPSLVVESTRHLEPRQIFPLSALKGGISYESTPPVVYAPISRSTAGRFWRSFSSSPPASART